MSWFSNWLHGPKRPDISRSVNALQSLSDQIGSMFTPETKADILRTTRQTGTQQIGQATSAANRAVGSNLASSGLYGSGPMAGAIQGNYAGASQGLAALEGELARLGLNFDQQQMQALLAQAGIQGQIGGLRQQDFQNQMANDPFGNILGLATGALGIGALGGFGWVPGAISGLGGLFGGGGNPTSTMPGTGFNISGNATLPGNLGNPWAYGG